MKSNKKAFTLIELIIVIVILGILAAIAVVGYNAIINNSKDTAVTQAANSFVTEMKGLAAFDAGTTYQSWAAYGEELAAAGDIPAGVDVFVGVDATPANAVALAATSATVAGTAPLWTASSQAFRFEKSGRTACVVFLTPAASSNVSEGSGYTTTVGATTPANQGDATLAACVV